jgi:uncharacterized membrane protein
MITTLFAALLAVATPVAASQEQEKKPPAPAADSSKGVLDVIVVDQEGNRLSGALVSVVGYRATTGLNGTARFGLVPARYSILVSKPTFRGRRVNAGVRPGETTTLRVVLQKLPPSRAPQ